MLCLGVADNLTLFRREFRVVGCGKYIYRYICSDWESGKERKGWGGGGRRAETLDLYMRFSDLFVTYIYMLQRSFCELLVEGKREEGWMGSVV